MVEALLVLLVIACVGFAGWYVHQPTHKTNAAPTTQPTAPSNKTVSVTDADAGKTIQLHTGDSLTLTLASTYWKIADPSNTQVIKMAGKQVTAPSHDCIPGGGCGAAVAHFSPVSAGSAQITASRTTCGEALACTGDRGSFSVTVVVK